MWGALNRLFVVKTGEKTAEQQEKQKSLSEMDKNSTLTNDMDSTTETKQVRWDFFFTSKNFVIFEIKTFLIFFTYLKNTYSAYNKFIIK